jgi:predicted transcriptional regulator
MADWNFLSNHGRVLLCIASDPGLRLRDIAERLQVTERTAYDIVAELTASGYVTKTRDGRRNRYEIQAHLPVKQTIGRELTVGEMLDLFINTNDPVATNDSNGEARDASRSG